MNDKLYIKKFIRDDGQKLSFDGDQIYLAQENTLLVRPDPSTTAINFTEADGGEMIRQQNTTYDQPINGLIIPKSDSYWTLSSKLSVFFKINHTYKIIYTKKDGSMFAVSNAWISSGLQIVPAPHEEYSKWSVTMTIGNVNWTEYAEDSQGDEIYSNTITLPLISAATGGEEWEYEEQEEVSEEGSEITFDDTVDGARITDLTLKGDTFQQTYSGKNILVGNYQSGTNRGIAHSWDNVFVTLSGTTTSTYSDIVDQINMSLSEGTYTFSINKPVQFRVCFRILYGGSSHDIRIQQGSTSATATIPSGVTDALLVRPYIDEVSAGTVISETFGIMLEVGSTASPFEPYVGTASPNPDYPQDVQVVTGAQTVKVSGKNSMPMSSASVDDNIRINSFGIDLAAGTYTISFDLNSFSLGTNSSFGLYMGLTNSSNVQFYDHSFITINSSTTTGRKSYTFTITDDAAASGLSNIRASAANYNNGARAELSNIQIEPGSSATAYEPYQSQSYTVDLGSIELCKIGDYQDYIYKSGSDWYVHKACGKAVFNGSETWTRQSTSTSGKYRFWSAVSDIEQAVLAVGYSNMLIAVTEDTYSQDGISGSSSRQAITIRYDSVIGSMDTTQLQTWLASNTLIAYYRLATPTDTKITDNTLIGELEVLYATQGYNDKTIITVSATGTNLPAILAVTLQNPTITGEVWDNVGTVWELGSGGTQTINIDSTTTVYPVWKVEGPCVDPILQNNTTDTIAQYDGTVAAGQTLTVNFADGTAYLDSALVTRYVNGLVSLRPGENTIGFNSDGGTTETSTISWNNIINQEVK